MSDASTHWGEPLLKVVKPTKEDRQWRGMFRELSRLFESTISFQRQTFAPGEVILLQLEATPNDPLVIVEYLVTDGEVTRSDAWLDEHGRAKIPVTVSRATYIVHWKSGQDVMVRLSSKCRDVSLVDAVHEKMTEISAQGSTKSERSSP